MATFAHHFHIKGMFPEGFNKEQFPQIYNLINLLTLVGGKETQLSYSEQINGGLFAFDRLKWFTSVLSDAERTCSNIYRIIG